MRTIETVATIVDGKMTVQVPPDLPSGEHRIVVVIDEELAPNEKRSLRDFPVIHTGSWPEDLSLRREDMYDEWGR